MELTAAFEVLLAVGIVAAAAALAAAIGQRVGRRILIAVSVVLGGLAIAAWAAFALDGAVELAHAASGQTA